ncbi:ABC transporter ATP-binding protein [Corynebacterium sp. H128]|uniref:ABC transporter ATP-binding protein n=1 Tax=Corynebacterium sp. H128 TaxID=3133427 RepID=UPI00309F05E3
MLLYFISLLVTHLADLSLRTQMRRDLLTRLSKAPLGWFTEASSGTVRKAIQDDTKVVHTVLAHAPVDRLNAILTPLLLFSYAVFIDWRLGLLTVATVPLFLFTYSLTMRGMGEKTAEMDGKLAQVSATMVELASGISVVKAFGRVGQAHDRYIQATNEFLRFYRGWCLPLVSISAGAMAWIAVPVVSLVNMGGGALMVHAGWVTPAEVMATTLIALVLPQAVMTVSTISWSYQLAGSSAVRLCELLDTPQLTRVESDVAAPKDDHLVVDDVSYTYTRSDEEDSRVEALRNVSLALAPGTVTALIGPSGSGKSTLGSLLARFDDPSSGTISLGGVDLRELTQSTLYSKISFVLQDAQLLAMSVADNIALGAPNASPAAIRAAAKSAAIDEFIMSLPEQYDTVVGAQIHLSGGQEQRIAIARALLRNTPILLLDEATAMADPESEADIQKALTRLAQGRTVIVIAHRPASIAGADQIAVLRRGEVIACGTHSELLDEPHYATLIAQTNSNKEVR